MKKGGEAFDAHYSERWNERWPALRAALAGENIYDELDLGAGRAYYLDPASVAVAALLPLPSADTETIRILDMCAAPGGKTLAIAARAARSLATGGALLIANERSAARRRRLRAVLDMHAPTEVRSAIEVTGHDAARWGLYEPERYDAILADVPCSSERHLIAAPKELARWSPSRTRRLATEQFAILAAAIDLVLLVHRFIFQHEQ